MGEIAATNRKAHFRYQVLDTLEAGIVLAGSEVKSIRDHAVSFNDSYARVEDDEVFVHNLEISPYDKATIDVVASQRRRKLLLHRSEIRKLKGKLRERGLTLVPLKVYFNERGFAKLTLGIAKGKTLGDKRETLKKREAQTEMRRAMGLRRR